MLPTPEQQVVHVEEQHKEHITNINTQVSHALGIPEHVTNVQPPREMMPLSSETQDYLDEVNKEEEEKSTGIPIISTIVGMTERFTTAGKFFNKKKEMVGDKYGEFELK